MRLRKKPWIEKAMPEVIEAGFLYREEIERFKGRWQERFPGREICLEIGCGKGGFITGIRRLSGSRHSLTFPIIRPGKRWKPGWIIW